jgi:nucleoside-diphosphate-sugar epimerase
MEESGFLLLKGVRKHADKLTNSVSLGEVDGETDLSNVLSKCSIVIHLAALAHVNQESLLDPLKEFQRINFYGTINLARQAAENGVTRFIYISSIGVNGNTSTKPFTESDIPMPIEPYAISKHRAEDGLIALSKQYEMEVVIIRPPLVYGPNSPGNFSKLIKLVKLGMPLPFASVNNKRSFIALSNLIDFIILCTKHPKAKNEVFVISDGDDISLPQLLKLISDAFGKKLWIFPFPRFLLKVLAKLCGKSVELNKLVCDLQVDITKAKSLLNWNPKYSVMDELNKLVV